MGTAVFYSPLRYPGGKGKLGPYFARVIASQSLRIDTYCEPYAGGAGAGLYLLMNDHVDRLIINDLNPGVAAMWRAILGQSEAFVESIERTPIDLDAWHRAKATYEDGDVGDDFELGFATFFLNRTNRSGILNARPIGGLAQTGRWLIDARFNRSDLVSRVQRLCRYANRIEVRQRRAVDLVRQLNRRARPVFLYVDPPYVVQGEELYMTDHTWPEHTRLSGLLRASPHPWILTYDVDARTRSLYPKFRCLQFGIKHTAQVQKIGHEYMIFSRGLRLPDLRVLPTGISEWVSSSSIDPVEKAKGA